MRIVFFGTPDFAVASLRALLQSRFTVCGVVTQPDKPQGRSRSDLVAPPVKLAAQAEGIPVLQPVRPTGDVFTASLRRLEPDLGVVVAYGHILRPEVLAIPAQGMINVHASLLPKYRGAAPIQWAIIRGERETGVTLHHMVRQLDAGPVADREAVPVGQHDTALEIEQKLAAACVPLLARALPRLLAGELAFTEQDHAGATFCRKLTKDDAVLDFAAPAAALAARINGLNPWPAVQVEWNGQPLKFGLADLPAATAGVATPGEVVGADAEGLLIGTGEGLLRVRRLQKPGGRMLAAPEFLRGSPVPAGTVFASRPMAPLVGTVPFPVVRKV